MRLSMMVLVYRVMPITIFKYLIHKRQKLNKELNRLECKKHQSTFSISILSLITRKVSKLNYQTLKSFKRPLVLKMIRRMFCSQSQGIKYW
jgi:hypothetical protein